jgi:hypothetical protein
LTIKKEAFKLIRSELKDVISKDLFKKFGTKKNKDDGRIIQNEEDEVIEVTFKDYQYVMTNFYGHWI